MTTKGWTRTQEAAALANAEKGLPSSDVGSAVPNPLRTPTRSHRKATKRAPAPRRSA